MDTAMRPCPWCKGTDLSISGGAVILPEENKYKGLHGHTAEIKCNSCRSTMTMQSKIKLSTDWAHSGKLAKQTVVDDWNNREKYLQDA